MDFTRYLTDLRFLAPEMVLVAFAALALLVHVFAKNGVRKAAAVIILGLTAAVYILNVNPTSADAIYSGTITVDLFSNYFKFLFIISGILTVILSFAFFDLEKSEPGEVYYLMVFAIIGMMFTVSSSDIISFYVSYELFAITSYILAGIFKKDIRSSEAGLKYFILGVLSSGIMILGLGLLFGLTGETSFSGIAKNIQAADPRISTAAMIMVFTGFFFKTAMVPFHMWTPDVYEGAPTPLVGFISVAPKAAVFAVMMRLCGGMFSSMGSKWEPMIGMIAVASMLWGNIAALRQNNLKRMFGYSSIAQAGYLMIGIAAWGGRGMMSVMFYLFVYLFMNTAAFAIVLITNGKNTFSEDIDDLNGLVKKSPLTAACAIVLLLSLTGIPPTGGFIGKYFLFSAAVERGMIYLAVAGALNSVISLFYYFRIGRAMFMEEQDPFVRQDPPSGYVRAVILLSTIVILLLGVYPGPLSELAMAFSLK